MRIIFWMSMIKIILLFHALSVHAKSLSFDRNIVIMGKNILCQGEHALYSLAGGYTGSWKLYNQSDSLVAADSDTIFSHTFLVPGNYKLQVSGSEFNIGEGLLIEVVGTPPPPNEIRGPDRVCAGIPIRFDAGTSVPNTTFEWSAPDAVLNTSVDSYSFVQFHTVPSHLSVRRVTTDAVQCRSDTVNKLINTATPPLHISGSTAVCHSSKEVYSLNYEDGDLYEWEVIPSGFGSVVENSNTPHPTVLWNIPFDTGALAKLKVKVKKCSVFRIQELDVFIEGIPNITSINLSSDTICSGDAAEFTITTNFPVNNAGSATWQWDDGFSGPELFPLTPPYTFSHIYETNESPVAFSPVITISEVNGCAGSVTVTAPQVTVMPKPIAVISPSSPLVHCGKGWTEILLATETTGLEGTNSFSWGNGTVDSSITVNDYGHYTLTLVNSVFGCRGTSSLDILEQCVSGKDGMQKEDCPPPPALTFSGDTAFSGNINMTASHGKGIWTSPSIREITDFETRFENMKAKVSLAGAYIFPYKLEYSPGCFQTYYTSVTVPYIPEMWHKIGCNQNEENYLITLYDHSTEYPLTPITSRIFYNNAWTQIGTGSKAETVQEGNTTQIYYEVISRTGMSSCTTSVSISTPEFPTVSIDLDSEVPNPGCAKEVVFLFEHKTTGSGLNFRWDFDEENSYNASSDNPIGKVYSKQSEPLYNPALTIIDKYGCFASDQTSVLVNVSGDPGFITAEPNFVCNGEAVELAYHIFSSGVPDKYQWYNQNKLLGTTTSDHYDVYQPGGYWVQRTSNYGCKINTEITVVTANQIPVISIIGNTKQHAGKPFTLNTQDHGEDYTYTWDGDAGGMGSSLKLTLENPGIYTYRVRITDKVTQCSYQSPDFTVMITASPSTPLDNVKGD